MILSHLPIYNLVSAIMLYIQACALYYCYCSARVPSRYGWVYRDESPTTYWVLIGLFGFCIGCFAAGATFLTGSNISTVSSQGPEMIAQPILLQFPGPLTLYPDRSKFFIFFLGSAFVTAAGVVMLVKQDHSAMMWFSVSFFAVCALVFGAILLPGSTSLTLDADGFRLTQFYFVRQSSWQNITNISTGYTPPSRTLRVRYNDAQLSGWRLARWETALLGYNAMLPDTYGMPADDLAALMARWRDRALGSVRPLN